jgi:hypothetical protein
MEDKLKIEIDPRVWEDVAGDPKAEKQLREMIALFEDTAAESPAGISQEEFHERLIKKAAERFPEVENISIEPIFDENDLPERARDRMPEPVPKKH